MKQLFIILFIGCFSTSVVAQELNYRERVHVYTDKDCYLAGEAMWVRFVVYDNQYKVSEISKTGYIEIADAGKPYVQLPLALEKGVGSVAIRLPAHLPGGVYRLSAYTRFMRNEGKEAFFTKDIVIVNPEQADNEEGTIRVKVQDANDALSVGDVMRFGKRSLASVGLPKLPANLIDVNVSVAREDIAVNSLRQYPSAAFNGKPITYLRWMPEYEGHIVTARIHADDQYPASNLAFVGNVIAFFNGKPFDNRDLVEFYTHSVYGPQEMVLSLINMYYEMPVDVKAEILSPYASELPETLAPAEVIIGEQSFMERYMALQLNATLKNKRSRIDPDIYFHDHISSYNLDEYNQFPTLEESISEFVHQVKVSAINGKKRIRVFMLDEKIFNSGNTLVLLDGIPIFDHEQALAYNPRFIQYLNLYNGRYVFGGRLFRSIVSLITYDNTLPHFILDEYSSMLEYTFPLLPETFGMPDYTDVSRKDSLLPDFRTTLYWQSASVESMPQEISFYTSDLAGRYRIVIEGITSEGKIYTQEMYFYVE